LIGINVAGFPAKELRDVMDKEKLTWRSFADPGAAGQGPIASQWNLSGTPTLYVVDHKGVIRHKWVGNPREKVIDAALDKLINEAEGNRNKRAK
jgi:hypothetical protein